MQISSHFLLNQRLLGSAFLRVNSYYSTQAIDKNERKSAISSGPGLEDFVKGDVENTDKWSNYTGELVKQKGTKRYVLLFDDNSLVF